MLLPEAAGALRPPGLGDARGQLLADDAGEDDVGGAAEDLRADDGEATLTTASSSTATTRARFGAQPAQQPPGRGPEVHRLLGRHAHAAHRPAAARAAGRQAAGRHRGPAGAAWSAAPSSRPVARRCSPCSCRLLRRELGLDDLLVGGAGVEQLLVGALADDAGRPRAR